MRAKMIVAVAGALSATSALAADWKAVTETADGTTVLLDVSSLRRVTKAQEVWLKFDFTTKRETAEGRAYRERLKALAANGICPMGNTVSMVCPADSETSNSLELWAINCANGHMAVKRAATYDNAGHILSDVRSDSVSERPLPDSVGEAIVDKVCALSVAGA